MLAAVRPERPAVFSIADQFLNRLAMKTAKHRHPRSQRLVDNQGPLIRKRRKGEDPCLRVPSRQVAVWHIPDETQNEIQRPRKAFERQPQRPVSHEPQLKAAIQVSFRPLAERSDERLEALAFDQLTTIQ